MNKLFTLFLLLSTLVTGTLSGCTGIVTTQPFPPPQGYSSWDQYNQRNNTSAQPPTFTSKTFIMDSEQIHSLILRYYTACYEADSEKLTALLTSELWERESQRIIMGLALSETLGNELPKQPSSEEIVTISDLIAQVIVDGKTMNFEKEGTEWKISSLPFTPTPTTSTPPLNTYTFGDTIVILDTYLDKLYGYPKPNGDIKLTFESVEKATSVQDYFFGQGILYPQGVFVAIYYSIVNNLNADFQPATQINDCLVLKDAKGRQWELIDFNGGRANSSDFAASKNRSQTATMIGSGFSSSTAIAFDVPPDATGLYLYSEQLGIKLLLGQ